MAEKSLKHMPRQPTVDDMNNNRGWIDPAAKQSLQSPHLRDICPGESHQAVCELSWQGKLSHSGLLAHNLSAFFETGADKGFEVSLSPDPWRPLAQPSVGHCHWRHFRTVAIHQSILPPPFPGCLGSLKCQHPWKLNIGRLMFNNGSFRILPGELDFFLLFQDFFCRIQNNSYNFTSLFVGRYNVPFFCNCAQL